MKRTAIALTISAATLAIAGCAGSDVGEVGPNSSDSTPSESATIAFVRKFASDVDDRDLDTIASRQEYIDAVLEIADAGCDAFKLADEDGVIDPDNLTSTTRYYLQRTSERIAEGGGSSVSRVVKGWELATEFQCPEYSPMIAAYQAAG